VLLFAGLFLAMRLLQVNATADVLLLYLCCLHMQAHDVASTRKLCCFCWDALARQQQLLHWTGQIWLLPL
jgi:hypothetical protein